MNSQSITTINMNDSFIVMLVEIFTKLEEDGKDKFMLLKLDVPLNSLHRLYERLSKVDVPPIETLTDLKKTYYWNI